MKLETIVMLVIVVGLVFAIVGLMQADLKTQYPDVETENLTGKYDYTSDINQSASKISDYFQKIGDTKGGWQVLVGIAAFPFAVIEAVMLILKSLTSGVSIITGLGTELGINSVILGFIIMMVTITILFALIKFWRKTEPVT